MGAPRWFYGTVAACVVVLTIAAVYALAFRPAWMLRSGNGVAWVVDTHTGTACVETPGVMRGTEPPLCVAIPSAALER